MARMVGLDDDGEVPRMEDLAELMAERGWTRDRLADGAGVAAGVVSDVRAGRRPMPDRLFELMQELLGPEQAAALQAHHERLAAEAGERARRELAG